MHVTPAKKLLAGYYRLSGNDYYANIKKSRDDGMWHAEIRNNDGKVVQFAGIWKTKKDAHEEAEMVLSHWQR